MDNREAGRAVATWALKRFEDALRDDLYPHESTERFWGIVGGTYLGRKIYESWTGIYKLGWDRQEVLDAMLSNELPSYFKQKVEQHVKEYEEGATIKPYIGSMKFVMDFGFDKIPWDWVFLARFSGDFESMEADFA
eukprot:jgi/Botrbrau1/16425/Bobra.0142s0024.1